MYLETGKAGDETKGTSQMDLWCDLGGFEAALKSLEANKTSHAHRIQH